ncbi:MAG TPA: hypothetical protein DCE41_13395 [Cytophagales bacterium]|nr:hypothetical protein [Cytophagales bacterium]HAA22438.1 hypothetical protein [Cytophagales bacterium]HAP59760.1 hypothetical protein [Cytophagales bacterium]
MPGKKKPARIKNQPVEGAQRSTANTDMKQLSDQAFKRAMDRPIYKQLKKSNLDNTEDEDLIQVVFDNLMEKLPSDNDKGYETVMAWNPSRRAIYMIRLLEDEVDNGGFNQFYYNSSGQFYNHLPSTLSLIGEDPFAELMKRANSIFASENEEIKEGKDGTFDGFTDSYKDTPLDELDREFYALNKDQSLSKAQIVYIRQHPTEFIDQ